MGCPLISKFHKLSVSIECFTCTISRSDVTFDVVFFFVSVNCIMYEKIQKKQKKNKAFLQFNYLFINRTKYTYEENWLFFRLVFFKIFWNYRSCLTTLVMWSQCTNTIDIFSTFPHWALFPVEDLMPIYMTRIKRLHNECFFSFYNPFLCHRCGTSGWVGRRIMGVIFPAGIRTEFEGVYWSRRTALFLKLQVLSTFPLDLESWFKAGYMWT